MTHRRILIREAVKNRLEDAAIVASGKVFKSRTIPWRPRDLPAIAVYTLSETVDPASANTAPRERKMQLNLVTEGAVHGVADIDDALDALAEKIEKAIESEETFGDLVADTFLASTDIELYEDGELYLGVIRLQWSITYYEFAPNDADADLDDFTKADIRYNQRNEQDEEDEAHDSITLPGAGA